MVGFKYLEFARRLPPGEFVEGSGALEYITLGPPPLPPWPSPTLYTSSESSDCQLLWLPAAAIFSRLPISSQYAGEFCIQ